LCTFLSPSMRVSCPARLIVLDLICLIVIIIIYVWFCLSRWPRGLRRRSWPLGYWNRWFESRSRHGCLCVCVVLSCVGRSLCDGLITRRKESYQVS
jgi:hypothetical protein